MKVNFPRWNRNDLSKSFACENFTPTHTILSARDSLKKKAAYWFRETGNCTCNGCGFAKLGPFHCSLQKLITTKIINNYIRWAQAPISSKPMLCTVDVPWFLRVEGQRSCRSPSFSLHHVCQKSKPQLATKHGFFNGIDCAYIACRRPSIPCFSEA